MDNLISRQAAIDAIEKTYKSVLYQYDGFTRADAIYLIKGLPSAQPEIIRCGECKYSRKEYSGEMWCGQCDGLGIDEDSFCSFAERRTNG